MTQELPSHTEIYKAMTDEQFNQIIDAILDGKYSWSCVLVLRCFGYNPLDYIPYRTYYRLLKENDDTSRSSRHIANNKNFFNKCSIGSPTDDFSHSYLIQINDISYIHDVRKQHTKIGGSNQNQSLSKLILESSSFKFTLRQHKIKKDDSFS